MWVSYAKDLIQPFGFYFFLCLFERWLKPWPLRALAAFLIPTLMEFGQVFWTVLIYRQQLLYMGNFDPLDIAAYAAGVALAALVEHQVLRKTFKGW